MTTHRKVQAVNINDLKRFAPEARVNQPLLDSRDLVTRMSCYEQGQVTPLHLHPDDDEVVFCARAGAR
jgi:quercetin dioxygenase-like cupin family protein